MNGSFLSICHVSVFVSPMVWFYSNWTVIAIIQKCWLKANLKWSPIFSRAVYALFLKWLHRKHVTEKFLRWGIWWLTKKLQSGMFQWLGAAVKCWDALLLLHRSRMRHTSLTEIQCKQHSISAQQSVPRIASILNPLPFIPTQYCKYFINISLELKTSKDEVFRHYCNLFRLLWVHNIYTFKKQIFYI